MGIRQPGTRRSRGNWILPVVFAVCFVIPAAVAAGPTVISALFDDDRVFSLCPGNRTSTQVVGDSKMIEDAPEYHGPGPHRLIVDGSSSATESLPDDWVPPTEGDGAYRIGDLQLVVCEYQYAVGAEGDLETCSYTPINGGPMSTFTAQSAKYDYKVYAATTGKQLARFTLKAIAAGCAKVRTLVGDSPRESTYAGYPDYDELRRRLEPLVTANVGG